MKSLVIVLSFFICIRLFGAFLPDHVIVDDMPAVVVNASVDTTGLATDTNQNTQIASLRTIVSNQTNGSQHAIIDSMPAVTVDTTGLATSSKQDLGIASLASIYRVQKDGTQHTIVDSMPAITVGAVSQGTSNSTANSWTTNIASFGSTAVSTGTGTGGAGIPRVTVSNDSVVGIGAGSAVIGHVIADTGSTTAVTGNVTAIQATGSNLHVAVDSVPTTTVTGTVTANQGISTSVANSWPTNIASFGATAVSTGVGASGAGIPRVTVSNDSSLAANQSVNTAQFGGTNVSTGLGLGGAGIPRVTISSDSIINATLGLNAGKTNIFKVASLATTATTLAQVVQTYTVTAGKVFYLQWFTADARPTGATNLPSVLGEAGLESPAGTYIASNTFVNGNDASLPPRVAYYFSEPIPIAANTVIRTTVNPRVTSNTTWFTNFGGYER